MDLSAVSVSGDLSITSSAHRSSHHCHLPFNHNPKSLLTLGAWKIKNHRSLRIRSALNKLTSDVNNSRDVAVGPASAVLERVFAKARKLEEMLSKNSSFSENDDIGMNLGLLESDLQAALLALRKKEDDLQDAERRVLLEQVKLHQTKQDLERRESEIVASLAEQKQIEEDLKKANHNLASQSRQIKNLKLLVKDQSKKIAASQSSLSLKEDEICKLKDELRQKDEEAEIMNSELESKKQLLDEATEIIRKQEEELKELQKEGMEKEHDLAESLQLIELEQERLKIMESNLEKQTVEWLLAQEELKAMAMQASKQMNDVKETSEDFKRVRKLLSDLRSELILSQKSFASSQKKIVDQTLLFEKEMAELNKQKLLVMSYMNNLKDAELEVENERVKLIAEAAQLDEFKSQLSEARKLIIDLKEEVHRERMAWEQQTQEITLLRKELQEKVLDFSCAHNLLQVKESELAEARLKIQQMKSEQDSIQLILQEKDADLLKAQKALAEVHNDIADLQKLMNSKEQQLVQATMRLREKEDHIFTMRHELNDSNIRFSEAASLMEKIAQLSTKLVVSEKNEDIGRICSEQLEKETLLPEMKQKQLEAEIKAVEDLLREKEMDLLTAQRALAAKEEELNAFVRRWEEREKEMEKIKEELWEDADGLKKLYSLAQERIGDSTVGDLAIEKLQLEAAWLETEAATSGLQKIHDLTHQLVEMSRMSMSLDDTGVEVSGGDLILDGKLDVVEVAEKEIARLLGLTEKLLKEACITITTNAVT